MGIHIKEYNLLEDILKLSLDYKAPEYLKGCNLYNMYMHSTIYILKESLQLKFVHVHICVCIHGRKR